MAALGLSGRYGASHSAKGLTPISLLYDFLCLFYSMPSIISYLDMTWYSLETKKMDIESRALCAVISNHKKSVRNMPNINHSQISNHRQNVQMNLSGDR